MQTTATSNLKPSYWRSACHVVAPDFSRLQASIKRHGFLSPLVIQPNGTIIDGYHRWIIANDCNIKNVPVVVVDIDDIDAMLLHVDMNRYRGAVIAKLLSSLIQQILLSKKYSYDDLRKRMALSDDEFSLLADGSLIKMRNIKEHKYSAAWVPVESKTGEDIFIERPTGLAEQV